jgi:hypothetical protein
MPRLACRRLTHEGMPQHYVHDDWHPDGRWQDPESPLWEFPPLGEVVAIVDVERRQHKNV